MKTRTRRHPFTDNCVALITRVVWVLTILGATAVQGAEWRIQPMVRVAGNYDDNATLNIRTDQEEAISGYIIDARARFEYASPTSNFFVTPLLRIRDYGDPRFDTDDEFVYLQFDKDTQKSDLRIRVNYENEAVRTAERADADLDIDDPDEIPDEETGRVFFLGDRQRIEVVPAWRYRLTDFSSLSFRLAYRDVQYDGSASELLDDYSNGRVNVTYERAWSPRYSALVDGTYRRYIPDQREESDGTGFRVGFRGEVSENTQLRVLAGVESVSGESGGSNSDWVADVSLVQDLQTITLLAQYRRSISGGGSGTLSSRDEINLNFTRQLDERISAGLGVRAYSTNRLEGDAENFDERDYLQLHAQFVWNLTRTWFVQADYRYTFLNRKIVGESANSNDVTLWLSYRPTAFVR
jgi:hypothetical protein